MKSLSNEFGNWRKLISSASGWRRSCGKSEEKYRGIFNNALVGIYRTRISDGKVIECNKQFARTFGYKTPEACMADFAVSGHYLDPEARQKMLDSLMEHGAINNYETRFSGKNGAEIWIRFSVRVYTDEGYLEGVGYDITREKRALEALRESEQRYRLLFENVSDIVYTIDPEFKLVDISPSVERVLGYKPKELIGRPFQDLNVLESKYLEQAFSDSIRILKGERIISTLYPFIARDGTRKWGEVSGAPLIHDNQVVGLISVARDITERKLAEVAMRNREQLLNEMGSIAKIGGWEHDLVTAEATWTRETYNIVEMESGPAPGPEDHLNYYPPKDRAVVEEAYRRAMETGEQFDVELQGRTARGRRIWVRVIGRPEFKDGKCVKMKGILQDITDRKQLEAQLQQAQKLESIGTLAGGIAHEFNNILSIIIGNNELVMEELPQRSSARESAEEIRIAGLRARDVVKQLLVFSPER